MCIHMHHVTYREMRPYGTKLSPRIGTLEFSRGRGRPGKRILQRTLLQTCKGSADPTPPYYSMACGRVGPLLFYFLWPRIGQIPYIYKLWGSYKMVGANEGMHAEWCRGRPAYEQGRQNSPTLPLQALQFIWAGAWPTILWGGAPPPWPWPLALINSRVGPQTDPTLTLPYLKIVGP